MQAKTPHHQPQPQPQPKRLVLISAEQDAPTAAAPLRILGTEPRLRGSFRLTDR
jgi:hypothetical protein